MRATRRSALHPQAPVIGLLAAAALGLASLPAAAAGGPADRLRGIAAQQAHRAAASAGARAASSNQQADGGEDPEEIADQAAQYAWERTAPAQTVPPAALRTAAAAAAAARSVGGAWTQVTHQPYQAEPTGYTDPEWSNAGAGFGLVSGRATAIAADTTGGAGGSVRAVYIGAADGGVWRSTDRGRTWIPEFQHEASISIGALLVGPDHAFWVGTGEANTSSDAYAGQGVYRSTDGGRHEVKVGGTTLDGALVYRLVDDGQGRVYAATSRGLFRTSDTGQSAWTRVLAPVATSGPYDNHVTDVVVRPGTHGRVVLAAAAWRSGAAYNGFYLSTRGGAAGTFHEFTPTGAIDATDIGRTTLAYAPDGSALYAIVESPKLLGTPGAATNLQGVFKVDGGAPTGPYAKIADSDSLGASGSALKSLPGYHVGVQSWYNQALAVDPRNPQHVYVSLEEVFETRDGGATFTTASPYWNYGLGCGTSCPRTTHPDQHALAVAGGQVWIGNDGGIYRRPLSDVGYGGWSDLNANLHTLQYYGAGTGHLAGGGTAYWGGLQDNGTSALFGKAPKMIEPAGGDGGFVLVDPTDGTNAVGEYVYLSMYLTTDGGHSFRDIAPPDSAASLARFTAPFVADVKDPTHWVAGGQHVYDDTAGWQTVCTATSCDWNAVHDLGTGDVATALAVNGSTTYAGWVAGGGNPGPAFASGIDTSYGGTWHRITAPNLPQRYIAGMAVDPADAGHVFAVYNGYSRRWVQGAGTGHVFESHDGGTTWSDISGNLPDVGGDDLVVAHGRLVVATDVGVFTAKAATPTRWTKLGSNLPSTSTNDLSLTPDGLTVVAATHGRGLWSIRLPRG